jgi:transcriptional adapter 3
VGKHYSLQWADEDLSQQIKEGSRCLDLDSSSHASAAHHSHCQTPSPGGKRKSVDPNASLIRKNSLIQESVAKINKLASGGQQTETSMSYGPLTQRLISALIEQNLMTPFDHEITDYLDKIGPPQTASFLSPKTLAKSFHFSSNHTQHIERKLKRTLIEQGILELDEVEAKAEPVSQEDSQGANDAEGGVDGDDEIAVEIGNLQAELRLVTRQCKQTISQLLGIAKLDMQRQEVKKSLDGVDHEVKISS